MAGEKLGSLHYELSLDSSKLDRGLNEADNKVKGFGNRFKEAMAGTVTASQTLLTGVAIAGTAMTAFGVASVGAFMESENAIAQTNAVLKSTGGIAGVTADDVDKLAQSFQRQTAYSDEAVRSAENMLLTFTNIHKDVFPQTTEAVLDMATAMGQDLQTTAIQVGKALQDPVQGVTALQRVGVRLTESQKELVAQLVATGDVAGAQRLILKELNTEFGGSAIAAGSTFGGALKKLWNIINDVMEIIGKGIVDKLRPLINHFIELYDKAGGAEGIFKKLKDTFQKLEPFIPSIAGAIMFGLAPAIGALVISMIPLNPYLYAFMAIGAILGFVIKKIVDHFGGWDKTMQAMKPILDWLHQKWEKIHEVWSTKIAPVLKDVWDWLEKHVITMDNWNKMVDMAKKTWDAIVLVWQTVVLPALKWLWHSIKDELIPVLVQFWQQNKDWLIPTLITLAAIVGIILVAGIVTAIVAIRTIIAVVTVVVGVFNWLSGVVQWVNDKFTDLSLGAFRMFVAVISWFSQLPGRIAGAIGNLGSILYNAGRDLLQGLINGINSIANNVVGALRNVANKLPQIVKDILGIRSPSQVFHEIGQNIGLGIAGGITSTTGAINTALTNLTPEMVATGLSVGNGVVGSSIRYGDTNITIGAVNNQSDADYLIRRIDHKQKLETKGVSTL